jgi:hypothetical protein
MRSFLVVAAAAMLAGACGGSGGGGEQDATVQDDGGIVGDGATQQDGAAQQDGALVQQDGGAGDDAAASCIPEATPSASAHRAGQACLSCHATMSGSRKFTLAGTVFDSATGTTGIAGATLRITPSSGAPFDLVTSPEGSFHTSQAIAFPVSITLSRCPDHVVKPDPVSLGDCNLAGCHASDRRIHLP